MRKLAALAVVVFLFGACGADATTDAGRTDDAQNDQSSGVAPDFGTLQPGAAIPTPPFQVGSMTLGGDVSIDVQVAKEGNQPEIGLMGVTDMPDTVGMVFLFEGEHQGGFWMKDTLIPLSIAFIDAQGQIVDILDMQPCEADPCPIYTPSSPYSSALEMNIGAFERLGVAEGDATTLVIATSL